MRARIAGFPIIPLCDCSVAIALRKIYPCFLYVASCSAKIKRLADEIGHLTLLETLDLTDLLKDMLGMSSSDLLLPFAPGGGGGGAGGAAAAAPAAAAEKPKEEKKAEVRTTPCSQANERSGVAPRKLAPRATAGQIPPLIPRPALSSTPPCITRPSSSSTASCARR